MNNNCPDKKCFSQPDFSKIKKQIHDMIDKSPDSIHILLCRYYNDDNDTHRRYISGDGNKRYYYEYVIGIYDKENNNHTSQSVTPIESQNSIFLKNIFSTRKIQNQDLHQHTNYIGIASLTVNNVQLSELEYSRIEKTNQLYVITISKENLKYNVVDLFKSDKTVTTNPPQTAQIYSITYNNDTGCLEINCPFKYENLKIDNETLPQKMILPRTMIHQYNGDVFIEFDLEEYLNIDRKKLENNNSNNLDLNSLELNIMSIFYFYVNNNTVQETLTQELKPLITGLFSEKVIDLFQKEITGDRAKELATIDTQQKKNESIKKKHKIILDKLTEFTNKIKQNNDDVNHNNNNSNPYNGIIKKLHEMYSAVDDQDMPTNEYVLKFLNYFDEDFKFDDLVVGLAPVPATVTATSTAPAPATVPAPVPAPVTDPVTEKLRVPVGYITKKLYNTKSVFSTISGSKLNPEKVNNGKYLVFITPNGKFSIYGKRLQQPGMFPPNIATRFLIQDNDYHDRKTIDKINSKLDEFKKKQKQYTESKKTELLDAIRRDLTIGKIIKIEVDPLVSYDFKNFKLIKGEEGVYTLEFDADRNIAFDVNVKNGGRKLTRRKSKSSFKKSQKKRH